MFTVDRPGDLTVRICSDCGGRIEGEHVRDEKNGVTHYLHPYRCKQTLQIREHTGETRVLRETAGA